MFDDSDTDDMEELTGGSNGWEDEDGGEDTPDAESDDEGEEGGGLVAGQGDESEEGGGHAARQGDEGGGLSDGE